MLDRNKADQYVADTYRRTWEDLRTTNARFDYLIIVVDGAGVYLTLELMKFLMEGKIAIPMCIKVYGICLASSILFNITALFCNFNVSINILKTEQAVALGTTDHLPKYQKKVKVYSFLNAKFMYACILSMLAGIVGLMHFFFVAF